MGQEVERRWPTPPCDPGMEECVLGAMMLGRWACDEAMGLLRPSDFYVPEHQRVFEALCSLVNRGAGVDPRLVYAALVSMGEDRRAGGKVTPDRLQRIEAGTPASANVRHYALVVADHAARRHLLTATGNIAEWARDPQLELGDLLARARAAVEDADIPPLGGAQSMNIDDFLAVDDPPRPWVVVSTLRRGERLVILAEEGAGKTTLLRQWAIMLSQGIHPFRLFMQEPQQVLLVDLENETAGSRDELHPLVKEARRVKPDGFDPDRLRVEFAPAGIDVTKRGDAVWLMERVAACRPDVLFIGPLYKLHERDESDAQEVRQIQKVLDLVRTRYGCALVMETHAPHESFKRGGRLRIAGSRVWQRWPEFIYGLAMDKEGGRAEWQPVRPPRYRRRTWPGTLLRDGQGFPWQAEEML